MGFKNTGFRVPTFNPIGFRTSGNILAALIKCGALSICAPEIDKVGKQTRDAVRGQTLLGNKSTLVEFPDYTDAELPDNFIINSKIEYKDIIVGATIYGFKGAGSDEFWLGSIDPYIRVDIWGASITGTTPFAIDDIVIIQVKLIGTTVELYANGNLEGTGNISKQFSNLPLQLFARQTSSEGEHSILGIDIENLDTGQTLVLDIPGRDSNGVIKLVDEATGEFYVGTQQNSPAIPTEDNNEVSLADDNGMSISQAQGNQLFDKSVAIIDKFVRWTDGVLVTNTGFYSSQQIYVKGATEIYSVTGSLAGTAGHVFLDENKNYIGGISALDANNQPLSIPSGTCYVQSSYSITGNAIETNMVNLGSTPLPYESYIGLYNDQLGQDPIEQGIPIPCGTNGLLACFDINGDRVRASIVGEIKRNRRIVDGVVDKIFSVDDFVVEIVNILGVEYYKLTENGTVGRNSTDVSIHAKFKPNTQYTFTTTHYEEVDSTNLRLRIVYDDFSADEMFVPSTTETTTVTVSDVGKTILKIVWIDSISGGVTYIKKNSFLCYEGTSLPSPLPVGAVTGNSTTWADVYGHILNSDTDLITVNADGTNKVMPFADIDPLTPTVNPQLFYNSSDGTIIFTEEGVTTGSDCYDKFIKYLGM